jgi:hypothetical protein
LRALAGTEDMRDIHAAAVAGDPAATAALEVYHHRLRHYLGAYLGELGGADAIVFTGGVGENAPATRAAAVSGMERRDSPRRRAQLRDGGAGGADSLRLPLPDRRPGRAHKRGARDRPAVSSRGDAARR